MDFTEEEVELLVGMAECWLDEGGIVWHTDPPCGAVLRKLGITEDRGDGHYWSYWEDVAEALSLS